MESKMGKKLKVGIVGCGTIGGSLAKAIVRDFSKEAKLAALFDINNEKSVALSRLICGSSLLSAKDLEELIGKSELVIEASSSKYSWGIARNVLRRRRDIMVMSVGGLLNHAGQLYKLSHAYKARVYIPSGAICGIDALKAACCGRVNKVILTTRKPPEAFSGVPYVIKNKICLEKIKKETVIFEGNAFEAIKAFPQNINVAATLSMAGLGRNSTYVRIIASRRLTRNIHEIEIDSDSGRIFSRTENVIHPDNPKTSFLAVLSAVATLRQILSYTRIGT